MIFKKWLPLILIFNLNACDLRHQIPEDKKLLVGSKKFTESVILAQIISQFLELKDIQAIHRRQLGGTQILWKALINGEIDLYPEYTGSLKNEILSEFKIKDNKDLGEILNQFGIGMSHSLGFRDNYALGMRREEAVSLGIKKISDLSKYPKLRLGLSDEFLNRKDGWIRVKNHYQLDYMSFFGMDHDLAYQALLRNKIDVTDLYSTDAEIEHYKLQVLEDDLHVLPQYDAIILYKKSLIQNNPRILKVLKELEGSLSEKRMIQMNAAVRFDQTPETQIASNFILKTWNLKVATSKDPSESLWKRLLARTQEHLILVLVSLIFAISVGLPLGVLTYRSPFSSQILIAITGVFQTIPSLALLVFLIPFFGIGTTPAIIALFIYSLLPIVRGTISGLNSLPLDLQESAEVLGLSRFYQLKKIEIPLAAASILNGIKTSAVINVGTATLGAIIGAGGFGQPILTGIRLANISLILEGAIPASLMALITQYLFEKLDHLFISQGLRVKRVI